MYAVMQRYEIAGPLSRDFRKRRKELCRKMSAGTEGPEQTAKRSGAAKGAGRHPKERRRRERGATPERAAPAISPGGGGCYIVTLLQGRARHVTDVTTVTTATLRGGKRRPLPPDGKENDRAAARRTGKKTTGLPPGGRERKRPDRHPPEKDRTGPFGGLPERESFIIFMPF